MSQHPCFVRHVIMVLMIAFVSIFDTDGAIGSVSAAYAQDNNVEESRANSGRPTKRVETHSPEGAAGLDDAQSCMESNDFACSIEALDQIIGNPSDYRGIDVAIAHKFRGYAYVGQDAFGAALLDFEKAIAHPSLPDWNKFELRFKVAQVALAYGDVKRSIQSLESWLSLVENPNAAAHFFAAQAYAQDDRLTEAEWHIEAGLAKMDPETAQKSWYKTASTIYLLVEKYDKAFELLSEIHRRWPDEPD